MQLNETEKMADNFCTELEKHFDERVINIEIFDVFDNTSHRAFKIRFEAYNYFIVLMNYDMGRIGCSIEYGKYYISLKNSQQWYSNADFNIFFQELKDELELRIPDKYLESNGWK